MRSEHEWTERNEEGQKREIRVTKQEGRWRIQTKIAGEENWTYHKHPSVEDLEKFLEVLKRKYQRRRASHEDIKLVEKMIHEAA